MSLPDGSLLTKIRTEKQKLLKFKKFVKPNKILWCGDCAGKLPLNAFSRRTDNDEADFRHLSRDIISADIVKQR